MSMTPDEQQKAIHKALGWQPVIEGPSHYAWKRGDEQHYIHEAPEYPKDLNAMHEAIRVLTDGQRSDFRLHLKKIWTRDYNSRCGYFPSHDDSPNATAAQRAEAFLRTLNLWTK